MSLLKPVSTQNERLNGLVGVGLRHPHYREALKGTSAIDFIEVHAENFFAAGGLSKALLKRLSEIYDISLHSTSMGLGSACGIDANYLDKLTGLVTDINPLLVSDHASFAWSRMAGDPVHAGDLLPIEFTQQSLDVLVANVDMVQQKLGRRILVENLSSYIQHALSDMPETEFLSRLVERAECGLIVDLNNLLVNANNFGDGDALARSQAWLNEIPVAAVGEFHLAGYSQVGPGELIIDDHSQAVSDDCWELYRFAIDRFGPVISLIEWDNDLPDWQTLLHQADIARSIVLEATQTEWELVYEA